MQSRWDKSTGPDHRTGFRSNIRSDRGSVHGLEKDNTIQLIGFGVGKKVCGTDITNIREILRDPAIETPENAPSFVRGVVRVRGEIIPVIDLKKRLGDHQQNTTPKSWVLVVSAGKHTTGYIVDSVSRIIKIQADAILPAPDIIMQGLRSPYIRGVCTVDMELVVVLDFKKMLSADEDQALEKMTIH